MKGWIWDAVFPSFIVLGKSVTYSRTSHLIVFIGYGDLAPQTWEFSVYTKHPWLWVTVGTAISKFNLSSTGELTETEGSTCRPQWSGCNVWKDTQKPLAVKSVCAGTCYVWKPSVPFSSQRTSDTVLTTSECFYGMVIGNVLIWFYIFTAPRIYWT